MKTAVLTFYILVWPAIAAIVLAVLSRGVWKDMRRARRNGEHLV